MDRDNQESVLKCVEECSTSHKACSRPKATRLPTRVIDCSEPEFPRLVTSPSSSPPSHYAALSYVWGENQPHRTTAENIDKYHHLIASEVVPKTIQDAIFTTHSLSIRYLWVDSLCIIQDSEDDKDREIEKIRIYFQNAYITIVAANAKRVSDGFLYNPPPWRSEPVQVPYPIPEEPGKVDVVFLYRTYAPWPTYDSPVDNRAWCLEERVLSPRRLVFCSHALQYECQESRVNVNGSPLGLPDLYLRLPKPQAKKEDTSSISEVTPEVTLAVVEDIWDFVVTQYTSRRLTKVKDKLVAFGAVAEQFQGLWPDTLSTRYIAGLWSHQLPASLLWQLSGEQHPLPEVTYRAPSWSWAAIEGTVETIIFHPQQNVVISCEVKSWEVTLKRETNLYGQVTAGRLVIVANVMRGLAWDPAIRQADNLSRTTQGQPMAKNEAFGRVTADSSEYMNRRMRNVPVVVAAISEGVHSVFGLALVNIAKAGAYQYRRIGLVRIKNGSWVPEALREEIVVV